MLVFPSASCFRVEAIVDTTHKSLVKKLWPLWVAAGCPLLLILLNSTAIAADLAYVLIGIPILLCIWVCLGILALVISIRSMRRREWKSAMAGVILPLIIVLALVRFWAFIHLCNYGGDVVHFIARRSFYEKEVRPISSDGAPRLLVFNRGGMIWSSRGYVYDESDEILRTESMRSTDWKARAEQTELSCGYYADPFPRYFSFTQHWYIASFNC